MYGPTDRDTDRQTDRQNLQTSCICGAYSGSPQSTCSKTFPIMLVLCLMLSVTYYAQHNWLVPTSINSNRAHNDSEIGVHSIRVFKLYHIAGIIVSVKFDQLLKNCTRI